jgi:NADH:ubiquinone reductase (H+-translocating)
VRRESRRPRVLVLGGGYVAVTLTRHLRRLVELGIADVTVATRVNYHAFHGFIGEMVTGRISPGNMLSPVRRIFAPATLHTAEIAEIALEERTVVTSRALDGTRFEIGYDHLVLALGSAESSDAYPGLLEHAFKLKSFEDCFLLKNHIVEMFELADIETDPEERRRLLTFFVAGGGFAGTEIAGELADLVGLLTEREYPTIRREECRVVLVHPGPTILPELYGSGSLEREPRRFPGLVEYATRHIERLGVEIMTGTRVAAATPNEVRLSDGSRVPTRTIVSAVGSRPQPILDGLPLERDGRGRVVTDAYLRAPGHDDVWAGGDCAAVPHPGGGTCPPVGIFALKHGTAIGRNIEARLTGRTLRRFRFRGLAQGVSIGKRTAVGEAQGITMRGFPAWLMWRGMLFYYFPTWDRRLRLLSDWAIWPLVGRDIVQFLPGDRSSFDVRENVFQAGEVISERGRAGRYVHVVVAGEAELLRVDPETGEEELITLLEPGSHFGRKVLDMSDADLVRAHTMVRTVAVHADQANLLQEVMASAGRLIARTGSFPVLSGLGAEREHRST